MGLGIDLGTSFTAAAYANESSTTLLELDYDRTILPTAVYVREDGSLAFGQDAMLAGAVSPERLLLDVKTDLGRLDAYRVGQHDVPVTAAAAAGLRHIRELAEARIDGFGANTPVTLSVPSGVEASPQRLAAYREAAHLAGFAPESIGFIAEPVAAAAAPGVRTARASLPSGATLLVYDLGGGTFDAAAVQLRNERLQVVGAPVGDDAVGGTRFDRAVLDALLAAAGDDARAAYRRPDTEDGLDAWRGRMILALRACREAKERLAVTARIPVAIPGVPHQQLTADGLDAILEPFIARTVGLLKQLDAEVRALELVPAGVLLVGGSCRLRLVPRMLAQAIDVPLLAAPDPARAVVTGAAADAYRRGLDRREPASASRQRGERRSLFAAFASPARNPNDGRTQ